MITCATYVFNSLSLHFHGADHIYRRKSTILVLMNNGRRLTASSDRVVRISMYLFPSGLLLIDYGGLDTDFGSITLVFSGTQTVSGLQIRTPEGEWKHVESIPGGITVNVRHVPFSYGSLNVLILCRCAIL
jgi:hypothetical protein